MRSTTAHEDQFRPDPDVYWRVRYAIASIEGMAKAMEEDGRTLSAGILKDAAHDIRAAIGSPQEE